MSLREYTVSNVQYDMNRSSYISSYKYLYSQCHHNLFLNNSHVIKNVSSTFSLLCQKEDIYCPACLGEHEDPRQLPCGHTYCLNCMHIMNQTSKHIKCQVCQFHHRVPDLGVKEFPQKIGKGKVRNLIKTCQMNGSDDTRIIVQEFYH